MWRDKLRVRKQDEIRRMELAKERMAKDLEERKRQLEEEAKLS